VIVTRRACVTAVLLASLRSAGADPCTPRAALDGDAAAVERVAAELERLGVEIARDAPPPALHDSRCRSVVAAVELDRGGGISVAVRAGAQRSEGRVVSDAALAAAWIDSWLHDGFEAPEAITPAFERPTVLATPALTVPLVPAVTLYDRFDLAATYDQMWTDDGERWSGFGASLCARVGALCLGARVRYASELAVTSAAAASRTDTSVLATASWSHELGRMSVAPELGLGVGRLTTDRVDGCGVMAPVCSPTDPTCMQPPPTTPPCSSPAPAAPYVGDGYGHATIAPRAAAALRLAIPVFSHVWLDGVVGVMISPVRSEGQLDAQLVTGPKMMGPIPSALPAEPLTSLQLGVGLRIGAP
jgi:hypothetical protein